MHLRPSPRLLGAPILTLLIACGGGTIESEPGPGNGVPVEFMEERNSWVLDFGADDVERAVSYYQPGATVLFMSERHQGRAAIRGWLEGLLPGMDGVDVLSADFEVEDDRIVERAQYEVTLTDGGVQAGTYVASWAPTDEGWRIEALEIR